VGAQAVVVMVGQAGGGQIRELMSECPRIRQASARGRALVEKS